MHKPSTAQIMKGTHGGCFCTETGENKTIQCVLPNGTKKCMGLCNQYFGDQSDVKIC